MVDGDKVVVVVVVGDQCQNQKVETISMDRLID